MEKIESAVAFEVDLMLEKILNIENPIKRLEALERLCCIFRLLLSSKMSEDTSQVEANPR